MKIIFKLITLDLEPNWAKILDPDPNSMYWCWSRTVQNFSRWHQSEQLRKKANKVDIYEYLDHGKAITALLLWKKTKIVFKGRTHRKTGTNIFAASCYKNSTATSIKATLFTTHPLPRISKERLMPRSGSCRLIRQRIRRRWALRMPTEREDNSVLGGRRESFHSEIRLKSRRQGWS